jgi:trehalose-phosphatase
LPDVKERIGLREIFYGGNHGLEISGPGISFMHDRAKAARRLILRAKRILEASLLSFKDAWLEDKKYTLSLHFRNATNEDAAAVKRIFYKSVSEFMRNESLSVIKGKKVLELTPAASWSKGKAALMVLDLFGKNWIPFMIGDDATDESVFEALKGRGITVKVGKSKKTSAQYYVKAQREVERLLASIEERIENI